MVKKETLCFSCYHAAKGDYSECPWARERKEVEGWKAKPTKLRYFETKRGTCYSNSFLVIKCPLYIEG